MRLSLFPLLLVATVSAQAQPERVKLEQDPARSHANLTLPAKHELGPTIPGLRNKQGAIPQGLAYWQHNSNKWLVVSCYFEDGRASVVAVLEAQKPHKMLWCLTLVEAGGKAHIGHVGGVAVSQKHLWVGSGSKLYHVPLASILAAAKPYDRLQLSEGFQPECKASYVGYHDNRVWVGEFVDIKNPKYAGNPNHIMTDRANTKKYAWAAGYALDADDHIAGAAAGKPRLPAILSVRQHVQGIAFLGGRIILSTSTGRKEDSALASYGNPLNNKHHKTKKIGDKTFQVWFLDKKNHKNTLTFPPMCEGITAYGDRLAALCESGAEKYQKGGRGPLDRVVYFPLP